MMSRVKAISEINPLYSGSAIISGSENNKKYPYKKSE